MGRDKLMSTAELGNQARSGQMFYSAEATELIREIKSRFVDLLQDLSLDMARTNKRSTVESEDVVAILAKATKSILSEEGL